MSKPTLIQLKTSCILNVPFQTYSPDFLFIVNGKEFKTSRLISELLSPVICKIHTSDPSFNQFIINTKHYGDFSLILKLVQFEIISIPENEIDFIYEVLKFLGNTSIELTKATDSNEPLTLKSVFSCIKQHEKFENFFTKEIESEIEFISSNFHKFSESQKEEILQLNDSIISNIVRNDKLKLTDEDELLNFINRLYKSDKKYEYLYENVIFSNVSSSGMKEFVDLVDFNDMSSSTWSAISIRLFEGIEKKTIEKKNRYLADENVKIFIHKEGQEMNGIIDYLTKKTGGNLHDKGTIEVTTNSLNTSNPPKNLLDLNQSNYYHSNGFCNDIWLCFDFKKMKIEITGYSLKSSSGYSKNCGNFKNWKLEVSDDGINWTKIDQHSNYTELNDKNIIKYFNVEPYNEVSRYCRLHHDGEYWGFSNSYALKLGCIEFYGKLKEEKH